MSQTLDYFFNYDGALEHLANVVRAEFGLHLARCSEDSEDFCGRLLSMDFFLGINECKNDLDIPFESYRYCLGLKTFYPEADLRPLQVAVMASMPYLLLRVAGIIGMLVFDVQYLVASYESRVGSNGKRELVDVASGTVVALPDLWQMISVRLPRRAATGEAEEAVVGSLQEIGRLAKVIT